MKLTASLRKFYVRHHELVEHYSISVLEINIGYVFYVVTSVPIPFTNVTYQIRLFNGFVIT